MLRTDIIKLLEENIGSTPFSISLSNIFWICTPKQGEQKQNKPMGLHPTEKLFNGKGNHSQNENAAYWTWENICEQYIWKGVHIQNRWRTHTIELPKAQLKIGTKHFSKEYVQMAKRYKKLSSISPIIWEMHIIRTMSLSPHTDKKWLSSKTQ